MRNLPEPKPPVVVKFVSRSIFSNEGKEITWVFGQPHPITKGALITRMFMSEDGSMRVFSVPAPGVQGDCTIDTIPADQVKIVQEIMSMEVFLDELAAAEGYDDDEDEEEEALPPPVLNLVPLSPVGAPAPASDDQQSPVS